MSYGPSCGGLGCRGGGLGYVGGLVCGGVDRTREPTLLERTAADPCEDWALLLISPV